VINEKVSACFNYTLKRQVTLGQRNL